jgi:hypothetical protein
VVRQFKIYLIKRLDMNLDSKKKVGLSGSIKKVTIYSTVLYNSEMVNKCSIKMEIMWHCEEMILVSE